jgi:hypothetical protein
MQNAEMDLCAYCFVDKNTYTVHEYSHKYTWRKISHTHFESCAKVKVKNTKNMVVVCVCTQHTQTHTHTRGRNFRRYCMDISWTRSNKQRGLSYTHVRYIHVYICIYIYIYIHIHMQTRTYMHTRIHIYVTLF